MSERHTRGVLEHSPNWPARAMAAHAIVGRAIVGWCRLDHPIGADWTTLLVYIGPPYWCRLDHAIGADWTTLLV